MARFILVLNRWLWLACFPCGYSSDLARSSTMIYLALWLAFILCSIRGRWLTLICCPITMFGSLLYRAQSQRMARSLQLHYLMALARLVFMEGIILIGSLSDFAQSHSLARSRIMSNPGWWLAPVECSISLSGSILPIAQSPRMARFWCVLYRLRWLTCL